MQFFPLFANSQSGLLFLVLVFGGVGLVYSPPRHHFFGAEPSSFSPSFPPFLCCWMANSSAGPGKALTIVSVPFAESWLGHLRHHYHTGTGECCRLQQALYGLFCRNPDQETRREDQHLFSLCPLWFCGVGLHRCGHPCCWRPDICAEPNPSSKSPELFSVHGLRFLHTSQCHLDCVRGLCSARYLVKYFSVWQKTHSTDGYSLLFSLSTKG